MRPVDDAWKDELLDKPFLSGLELMQMPDEHRQWIGRYGHAWYYSSNQDGCYNLLHRDNAHMRAILKK
jgi:hypothetical protein